MKENWITYDLLKNLKIMAILKQINNYEWLCVISNSPHWEENNIYERFKKGKFKSIAGTFKTGTADIYCVCRPSTKKEINKGKEALLIRAL